MKNKLIYMFFTLQFLLVMSYYQKISTSLFSISVVDILMAIISVFSFLYIIFITKKDLYKKLTYLGILIVISLIYVFNSQSHISLLRDFYFVSTFSFLIFYFINNKIDIFKIIGISILILALLDIYLLFVGNNSIIIELFIIILLGLLFSLYNEYKKIFTIILLLTVAVSIINGMNFVLYNILILFIISIFSYRNRKDLMISSIFVVLSILVLIFNNLLSFTKFTDVFNSFNIDINLSNFIITGPIMIIICYIITRYLTQKEKSLELKIYIYISILLLTLSMISYDKVYNYILIIYFSLLISILLNSLKNSSKDLKNEITFFVLHLGYGGIESSTVNTANELSKYYKVNIISFYNLKRNIESTIDKSIKIKHLYNGGPNRDELIDSIKRKDIINIFKNGIKAVNILILKEYLIVKEIYQCNSKYLVSTRNEFNILLSEYGNVHATKIAQEHMHHRDNKKYINNIKYGYNNINYLFALTKSLKDDYELFLKNNKTTKVVIVPNIIYMPNNKSSLNSKNLITISRLNSIKRIDVMIEMFSKIKNKKSKLYIVGDGEELEKLKNITNKLNLNDRVIFTLYKTKEEMKEYLLDSSAFLLASESEGLPMVLLEAMSYGIPCIAFNTRSGVSDIIDNNVNGYIIDNRDSKKYIESIDYLLDNKELLNEFGNNAIKKSKKFTAKEIIKKWQEVLSDEK